MSTMSNYSRAITWSLIVFTLGQATLPQAMAGEHWLLHALHRTKPPTAKEHSVEALAQEIDYLEHHIDTYGTVVPKSPDVWGQARLTKHRQEYERTMEKQLGAFKETMQGAIRRSDEAYLGMALSLGSASKGNDASATSSSLAISSKELLEGLKPATDSGPKPGSLLKPGFPR